MEQTLLPASGPVGPLPDGSDEPYWAGMEAGELRVPQCASCGHWTWPPQFRCGDCGGWDYAWKTVPATCLLTSGPGSYTNSSALFGTSDTL